jgi:hypothetical protein
MQMNYFKIGSISIKKGLFYERSSSSYYLPPVLTAFFPIAFAEAARQCYLMIFKPALGENSVWSQDYRNNYANPSRF